MATLIIILKQIMFFGARPGSLDQTVPRQTLPPSLEPKPVGLVDWEAEEKDSRLWIQIASPLSTSSVTTGK